MPNKKELHRSMQAEVDSLRSGINVLRMQIQTRRIEGGNMSNTNAPRSVTGYEIRQQAPLWEEINRLKAELAVATARADGLASANVVIYKELQAERKAREKLEKALHGISLGAQNSSMTKEGLGREARFALKFQQAYHTEFKAREDAASEVVGLRVELAAAKENIAIAQNFARVQQDLMEFERKARERVEESLKDCGAKLAAAQRQALADRGFQSENVRLRAELAAARKERT